MWQILSRYRDNRDLSPGKLQKENEREKNNMILCVIVLLKNKRNSTESGKSGGEGHSLLYTGKVPLRWGHLSCDLNDFHLKIWGESLWGRKSSKYKDLKLERCLAWLRNRKGCSPINKRKKVKAQLIWCLIDCDKELEFYSSHSGSTSSFKWGIVFVF